MAAKKFEKQVVSVYNDSGDIPTIVEDVRLENKSLQAAKVAAAKLQKKYNLEPTSGWVYLDFMNDYRRFYVNDDGVHTIFIHHFQENNVPNNGDVDKGETTVANVDTTQSTHITINGKRVNSGEVVMLAETPDENFGCKKGETGILYTWGVDFVRVIPHGRNGYMDWNIAHIDNPPTEPTELHPYPIGSRVRTTGASREVVTVTGYYNVFDSPAITFKQDNGHGGSCSGSHYDNLELVS